jgi:hypothetical protein
MIWERHGQFPGRRGWFLSQTMVNLRCNIFFLSIPSLACFKLMVVGEVTKGGNKIETSGKHRVRISW